MTEIKGAKYQPNEGDYQKELQANIARFENALISYPQAKNSEEKEHLQSIMKQQMDLIQSHVREIKRSGAQKQGETVEGDFKRFIDAPNEKNQTTLQQDIATLKEYTYNPKN